MLLDGAAVPVSLRFTVTGTFATQLEKIPTGGHGEKKALVPTLQRGNVYGISEKAKPVDNDPGWQVWPAIERPIGRVDEILL